MISWRIWFNDKAQFHFNGYRNKQNTCVYTSEDPCNIMETTSGVLFDSLFQWHCDCWPCVLHEECLMFHQRMGVNFRETSFQHDRAWTHTANAVLDVLNNHSDDRVLSNHFCEWFRYSEIPASFVQNLWHWLQTVMDANGACTENVFDCQSENTSDFTHTEYKDIYYVIK